MSKLFSTKLPGSGIAKDKQRISNLWILLLLGLAILPLLLINLRLLAAASASPSGLLVAGEWLNSYVHLNWINPGDRGVILYVLLLPMAALLTAFTRLTLGVRVLGFRAILIAIGFQEIGFVPSLLLITLVTGTVLLVRPSMRRSGMPLFARVAVIMCIVVLIMVLALFAGNTLNSSTLWSMAFFPVVILAMLAESIAATFARDNPAMAAWRTGTTIVLAAVIAGLSQLNVVQQLVLHCPELLLLKLVLIVFISEFVDLRIFEGFRPGDKDGSRQYPPQREIVIVRNRFGESPIYRTTPPAPRRYHSAGLQRLIDALRSHDYAVSILEGDSTLAEKLRDIAARAQSGAGENPVILNFAGGLQGAGRMTQVPIICEMLGLPYSGPGPQSPALLDDRKRQLQLLESVGLSVPKQLFVEEAEQLVTDSNARVWIRARFQSDRGATAVRNKKKLLRSIRQTEERYGEVLLEHVPAGRAVTVIVVSPEKTCPRVLPLLQGKNSRNGLRALKIETDGWTQDCSEAVCEAAIRALRAFDCKDLARVDLYCTNEGQVTVCRVLALEPISTNSATLQAMELAGLSALDIATILIESANDRWRTRAGFGHKSSGATLTPINVKRSASCITSASSVTA